MTICSQIPGYIDIDGIRISGDGSKVFVLTATSIQARSVWTGKVTGQVELKGRGELYLDPLCTDGSRIWVYSRGYIHQGWDFGISGSPPIPLSNLDRPHLNLTNWESSASIEDTVTGKRVFQLHGRYAKPTAVCWDGQYLVAGYGPGIGEVLILKFNHMLPQ